MGRLDPTERWLATFSPVLFIGFAVLDNDFRYRGINSALAAMNGVAASAHNGRCIDDVVGEAALSIKTTIKQLLASGADSLSLDVLAQLPTMREPGHWVETYFKIRGQSGKVTRIGGIVVDVSMLESIRRFTHAACAHHDNYVLSSLQFRLRHEIDEYYGALRSTMERVIVSSDYPDDNINAAVLELNKRVSAIQAIVADAGARLQV